MTDRTRNVLYLSPLPPAKSGIADYASVFQNAVHNFSSWRLIPGNTNRIAGRSFQDLMTLHHRVSTWKRAGTFTEATLIHAELGFKEHDEFYTLLWCQRLAPEIPICVTVHDPPQVIAPVLYPLSCGWNSPAIRRILRVGDYTPIGRGVVRSVLRRAKCLFVLSRRGAASLKTVVNSSSNVHVIPHVMFTPPPVGPRSIDGIVRILFAGFWGPFKGLEVLLEAFEIVNRRSPGIATLLLTGSSSGDSEFVRQISRRVEKMKASGSIEILGYLTEDRLGAAFASADIMVLPNVRDSSSCSGTALRGMTAALPIVASRVSPFTELLSDKETALLVPPNNAEALAKALLLLIGDRALRERLGKNSQLKVERENSASKVGSMVGEIYDAIVGL